MSLMDPKNYEVFKNSAFPGINRPISSNQKNIEDKKKMINIFYITNKSKN